MPLNFICMKNYVCLAIICLSFFACKQNKTNFTVEGTIKNMGSGEIYFIKSGDTKEIDTVKVKDDKFIYTGYVSEPTVYMLNFGAEEQPAFVILEEGKTQITYKSGSLQSLQVKGGKQHEIYNQFLEICKPTFIAMDSIGKQAAAHEQDISFIAFLQQEFKKLDDTLKQNQFNFIQNHPQGVATAFLAMNYFSDAQEKSYTEINSVYDALDKQTKESYYGKKLFEIREQMKSTSIDAIAPNFSLPDADGKLISLKAFKGKITLIDFWASWCGPCRAENPNVVKAYKKFHDKGFEILAVSLDNKKEKWIQAIQQDGLQWTHVSDLKGWESSINTLYGISSIPANYLLDAEGRILAKNLRGDKLQQKLDELFK